MHIKIEDFQTGWYGLEIGLRERDIDELIEFLTELKKRKGHIHIVCSDKAPAVQDIEIYWADDSDKTNSIFSGFPIDPTNKQ